MRLIIGYRCQINHRGMHGYWIDALNRIALGLPASNPLDQPILQLACAWLTDLIALACINDIAMAIQHILSNHRRRRKASRRGCDFLCLPTIHYRLSVEHQGIVFHLDFADGCLRLLLPVLIRYTWTTTTALYGLSGQRHILIDRISQVRGSVCCIRGSYIR
ncbi:hypothetical protein D3C73_1040900 [compost metagenome]